MPADVKAAQSSAGDSRPGERDKALDLVLGQIERNFGKGSIMRLGDASRMRVETISTGALTLDLALGGGYPKGRVVEVYGPESSGKTTLTLHAIAEVQRRGGVAAFVDAEHALDPVYAASLGVDVENLLVSQPDTGEMALEIVDQLVRSAAVDIVVIDSVAALTPRAEIEGEMGDLSVGGQARLMSQAMRKITVQPDLPMLPVILRMAWLIKRAWPPTDKSPISPSISARGVNAATESITTMSTAAERTS